MCDDVAKNRIWRDVWDRVHHQPMLHTVDCAVDPQSVGWNACRAVDGTESRLGLWDSHRDLDPQSGACTALNEQA